MPKGVSFDYTVKDSAGPRGAPVKTYKIQFQGLTTKYQNKFPQCTFGDTDDNAPLATVMQNCGKAKVGGGRVESLVAFDTCRLGRRGPNDVDLYANLQLTLFNIPGGLSIRLDADPPAPTSQDGPFGGPVPTHTAINARHKNVKINGIKSSSLEFDVPEELRAQQRPDDHGGPYGLRRSTVRSRRSRSRARTARSASTRPSVAPRTASASCA